MEASDGRAFAEQTFSYEWLCYLAIYGINDLPGEWFYRTISQAYDAFAQPEQEILVSTLVKKELQKKELQKPLLTKRYMSLFDEVLEPYYLQKLSVFTAREIFSNYLTIAKERKKAYQENEKVALLTPFIIDSDVIQLITVTSDTGLATKQAPALHEDEGIIDVTGEGQAINFESTSLNTPGVEDEVIINSYYDENYKLGNRYKKTLDLSDVEVVWLNKFWDPSNSFLSVEQCCIAVIKLYLLCLKEIMLRFIATQHNFFDQVKKFITQNQSHRNQYCTIEQFKEQAEAYIYLTFFRRAESAVREAYRHKRKINSDFKYTGLSASFERRFGNIWNEILSLNKINIVPTDNATELKLNELNVTRWKPVFDEISACMTNMSLEQCASKLDTLAEQNVTNNALENIYFEASKLFVKDDKLTAVKFYLKYVHADLYSDKIDNKQLGKTIQKGLFASDEQLNTFEAIINELIKTKDLATALLHAPDIYTKKRKKIELDYSSIENVKTQHQSTVNKLNQLLQDEEEVYKYEPEMVPGEIELKIIQTQSGSNKTIITSTIVGIALNEHQKGLLILFGEKNHQLEDEVLSHYAKSKSLFKNQLIESINDCCYEQLDDVLIEETSDGYQVNEYYYNKIINLC